MEIGVYQAKTHFADLISRVERGERVTITKRGKPVAELSPTRRDHAEARKRAVDDMFRLRETLRARGARITKEEIIAWKNAGRR